MSNEQYVAGLVDGEFGITSYDLQFGNTERAVVKRLLRILRSWDIEPKAYLQEPKYGRKKPYYILRINGKQNILKFATKIIPYIASNAKREKLLTLAEKCRIKKQTSRIALDTI